MGGITSREFDDRCGSNAPLRAYGDDGRFNSVNRSYLVSNFAAVKLQKAQEML